MCNSNRRRRRISANDESTNYTNNKSGIRSLAPTELSYIAAVVDADGSIVARVVPQPEYKMGWVIRVNANVHQSSKRRLFLNTIQQKVGLGSCRTRKCGTMSDFSINSIAEVKEF